MKPIREAMAGCLLASCLIGAPLAAPRQEPIGDDTRREEIEDTIEIYMIAKLKRTLGLSEAQEKEVVPIVEALSASRREVNRQRRLTLMKLRPLVEEEPADQREIARLLTSLDEMDRKHRETEMEAQERIRASLSPVQQARLLFFQERFRRELQDRLRRLQQDRGAVPDRPHRAPPGSRPPR